MAYGFGSRIDDDSYALTIVDEDQGTAVTKGEINGVPFESGGGGSSDFSAAEVTFDLSSIPSQVSLSGLLPVATEAQDEGMTEVPLPALTEATEIFMNGGELETFTVPLYKGKAFYTNTSQSYLAVSGNAELYWNFTDPNTGEDAPTGIIISGDCTITFSQG